MSTVETHEKKANRASAEEALFAKLREEERRILSRFSGAERQVIVDRLNALKGTVDMVSADTRIQVFANDPGAGWFWDPKHNYIRIDAGALLTRPLEENRFFMAHEAAHRRLTCLSTVPQKLRENAGFHMLFNVVEDGRINLWLQEKYPLALREGMHNFYASMGMDTAQRELIASGRAPYVMLAYNEMLRLWFAFARKESCTPTPGLPRPVRAFINAALPHLKELWKSYPAPGSEGRGRHVIERHAKRASEILVRKIWPLFKKLLKEDTERGAEQKALEGEDGQQTNKSKTGQSDKGEGGQEQEQEDTEGATSQDSEQQENGEQAEGGKAGAAKEAFNRLPKGEQDALVEESEQEIGEAMEEVAEAHEGKMGTADDAGGAGGDEADSAAEAAEDDKKRREKKARETKQAKKKVNRDVAPRDLPIDDTSEKQRGASGGLGLNWVGFERMQSAAGQSRYNSLRAQAAPVIKALIARLESIFKKRQLRGEGGGHRDGEDIDVDRVIDEKASTPPGTPPDQEPAVWTRPHSKEDGPRDYAFSIVLDVSGSMAGRALAEALRGVIAVVEALAYFGIEVEVIGFDTMLYEAKPFDKPLNAHAKGAIGSLKSSDEGTLMGRAIRESGKRLEKRRSKQKTMIVMTDGEPGDNAGAAIEEVREKGIEVIGVGIGSGTGDVAALFGASGVGNVPPEKLADTLAELIRKAIDKK